MNLNIALDLVDADLAAMTCAAEAACAAIRLVRALPWVEDGTKLTLQTDDRSILVDVDGENIAVIAARLDCDDEVIGWAVDLYNAPAEYDADDVAGEAEDIARAMPRGHIWA